MSGRRLRHECSSGGGLRSELPIIRRQRIEIGGVDLAIAVEISRKPALTGRIEMPGQLRIEVGDVHHAVEICIAG